MKRQSLLKGKQHLNDLLITRGDAASDYIFKIDDEDVYTKNIIIDRNEQDNKGPLITFNIGTSIKIAVDLEVIQENGKDDRMDNFLTLNDEKLLTYKYLGTGFEINNTTNEVGLNLLPYLGTGLKMEDSKITLEEGNTASLLDAISTQDNKVSVKKETRFLKTSAINVSSVGDNQISAIIEDDSGNAEMYVCHIFTDVDVNIDNMYIDFNTIVQDVDILIVGGGGAGGYAGLGGGGGGGAVMHITGVTLNGRYYVKVGDGGDQTKSLFDESNNLTTSQRKGKQSYIFKNSESKTNVVAEGGEPGGQSIQAGTDDGNVYLPINQNIESGKHFGSGGGGGGPVIGKFIHGGVAKTVDIDEIKTLVQTLTTTTVAATNVAYYANNGGFSVSVESTIGSITKYITGGGGGADSTNKGVGRPGIAFATESQLTHVDYDE